VFTHVIVVILSAFIENMLNSPIIIVSNALFLGEGLNCLALACKNWYYIIYLLKEEGKCVYIGMCFNLSLQPWQGNFDRLLWMCILQWSLDCLALTCRNLILYLLKKN
jgi:hypothetical protein